MHSPRTTSHATDTRRGEGPGRSRRPRLLLGAAAALAACGLLGGGVAYADSGGDGSRPGYEGTRDGARHHRALGARGVVASVDGTTFVVTTRGGDAVTVTTTDATLIATVVAGELADATVGSYVVVHGKAGDDGAVAARAITVKPAPVSSEPARGWHWRHGVAGTVTASDLAAGTLTISTDEGPVTVTATADTKVTVVESLTVADLVVGATVAVKGTFADDGTLSASRVKVWPASSDPLPSVPAPAVTDAPADAAAAAEPAKKDDAPPAAEADARFRGTVTAVDGATFTMTARDGTAVTVTTDAATVFAAGRAAWDLDAGATNTLASVVAGAEVKVLGTMGADGTIAATIVAIADGSRDDHARDGRRGSHRSGEERGHGGGSWPAGGDDLPGGRALGALLG